MFRQYGADLDFWYELGKTWLTLDMEWKLKSAQTGWHWKSEEPKSKQWSNLFLYNHFWQDATFVWVLCECGLKVIGFRLLQITCVSVCRPVCLPAGSLCGGLHICLHVPFGLLLEWINMSYVPEAPHSLLISSHLLLVLRIDLMILFSKSWNYSVPHYTWFM